MRSNVRAMLDSIDTLLAHGDRNDARDLWNVLTALRGPDKGDDGGVWKAQTTNHIRRAAFPKCAAWWDEQAATWHEPNLNFGGNSPMCASFAVRGKGPVAASWEHFQNHIRNAADALDLETTRGAP